MKNIARRGIVRRKNCPEGKLSGGNYPGILNGGNCPKPVYDNFIGLMYFWVSMAMAP